MELSLTRIANGVSIPSATTTIRTGSLIADAEGAAAFGTIVDQKIVEVTSETSTTVNLAVPAKAFRIEITTEPSFAFSSMGIADTRELGTKAMIRYGTRTLFH